MKLSEETKKEYFDEMNKEVELSEDELENVAGGWEHVNISSDAPKCPACGGDLRQIHGGSSGVYDLFACAMCPEQYRHYFYLDKWIKP